MHDLPWGRILEAVLSIVTVLVVPFVINFLNAQRLESREKLSGNRYRHMIARAAQYVAAAEQIYSSNEDKFEFVRGELLENYPQLKNREVQALVEGAVFLLKNAGQTIVEINESYEERAGTAAWLESPE